MQKVECKGRKCKKEISGARVQEAVLPNGESNPDLQGENLIS